MDDVLETPRAVDPSFRAVPSPTDSHLSNAFINARGFKVEFLMPNTGKDSYSRRPATMPALGGSAAQPLRFLDFLIYQPVRSVLLHKAGVPLLVPAPERYAVHKLIVATERKSDENGRTKSRKDVMQSGLLIEAMDLVGQSIDLGLAWMEAWDRGPGWRDRLAKGLQRLSHKQADLLRNATFAARRAEADRTSNYGFG